MSLGQVDKSKQANNVKDIQTQFFAEQTSEASDEFSDSDTEKTDKDVPTNNQTDNKTEDVN